MSKGEQKPLFKAQLPVPVEPYFQSAGYHCIAGVDEVGRGALAGPLVTAAVILDPARSIPGIGDSKMLTAGIREILDRQIRKTALGLSLDVCPAAIIDRIGIQTATKQSMMRSIQLLALRPDLVLIDYIELESLDITSRSLIKGDRVSLNIGAASIVAKVYRDHWMKQATRRYPEYGFEDNKGYGTARHLSMLRRYGPCSIHRKTFKSVTGPRHGLL